MSTGKLLGIVFEAAYQADSILWRAWILNAMNRGHTVYCTTQREDTAENRSILGKALPLGVIPVFCGEENKQVVLKRQGVRIDLWVCDLPEMTTDFSKLKAENLRLQVALDESNQSRLRFVDRIGDLQKEIDQLKGRSGKSDHKVSGGLGWGE